MLQRDVVHTRCQVDLTAQVVNERPTQLLEGTWSTSVGEIRPRVVARSPIPDQGQYLRVQVLNLTVTPLRLAAGQDLVTLECVLALESAPPNTVDSVTADGAHHFQPLLEGLNLTVPVTCRDILAAILRR